MRIWGRLLLVAGVVLFGLPFLWVIVSSFKSGMEILQSPWALPEGLRTENFANAWNQGRIGQSFWNSVVVTLGTLVILLPISAMAAYVLSRFRFWGRGVVFALFVAGMIVPHFLAIVPLFFLTNALEIFDTRFGLVLVYVAFSLPFTIFVLSGFFEALPNELAEAASIDGCSEAKTFWKVMAPLAKPGLVVVAIFNCIGLWGEFNLALVLVPSSENRTLPLGIAELAMQHQYTGDYGALFAALVIVMMPIVALYWAFKRHIHSAMLAGALKG